MEGEEMAETEEEGSDGYEVKFDAPRAAARAQGGGADGPQQQQFGAGPALRGTTGQQAATPTRTAICPRRWR